MLDFKELFHELSTSGEALLYISYAMPQNKRSLHLNTLRFMGYARADIEIDMTSTW